MAALCRSMIASPAFRSQLFSRNSIILRTASQPISLKIQKAKDEIREDHDIHNMKLGRPLSPHLTIYSFQLTSILSISHRFSGMALSGYMMALGLGAIVLPNDISYYASAMDGQFSSLTLAAIKFAVAFPLCYHWANGIRHLTWDTGRYLTNKGVYSTGYTMLGLTAFLTAIVASL